MRNFRKVAAVSSAIVLVCGCVSTIDSPYRDPGEPRGVGTEFTAYDFQQSAIAMVDSMLSSSVLDEKIKRQFNGSRPIVKVMPVANRTYRIFDLSGLSQGVETRLLNSGRFDFVDRNAEKMLIDEKTHDDDSVLTGGNEATDFGNHARADYLLSGELIEVRDAYGKTRESYYKLTMKLLNKKTGMIDWSGEKEIRKVATRPTVGW